MAFVRGAPSPPPIPYAPWPRCRGCSAALSRDGLAPHEAASWCPAEPCQRARARWEIELADFLARYPTPAERLEAILRGEIDGARERRPTRAQQSEPAAARRATGPVRVVLAPVASQSVLDELWDAADRGEEHLEPEIRARGVELIRAEAYL